MHSAQRPGDWHAWLSAEGMPELRGAQQLQFETRNFAIAAAVRGLGVAIIDPLLVQEELKDGRLLQPFTHTVPTRSAYYLVWSGRRGARIRRSWLHSGNGSLKRLQGSDVAAALSHVQSQGERQAVDEWSRACKCMHAVDLHVAAEHKVNLRQIRAA